MARKKPPQVYAAGNEVVVLSPLGSGDKWGVTLSRREALAMAETLVRAAEQAKDPKKVRAGQRGGEVRRERKRRGLRPKSHEEGLPSEVGEYASPHEIMEAIEAQVGPEEAARIRAREFGGDLWEPGEENPRRRKAAKKNPDARAILRRAMRGT